MIILENCPICKASDFKSLEYLRHPEYWHEIDYRNLDEGTGFKICKSCGFVTYDYIEDERLSRSYNATNKVTGEKIVTQNRKMMYHKVFLADIIPKMKGKKILDVGCATGHYLSLFDADRNGMEFDTIQANYAKYNFNVNIVPEMKYKYDLISYYHVLEHIQNPDKEIERIKEHLSDDGYLYIAVPLYDKCLFSSDGSQVFDFENLYHLNHVNCFTLQGIKNLLKDFDIVKEDNTIYGSMLLLKKADKPRDIIKQDYKHIVAQLEHKKKAIELLNQKKFDEAIEEYPNYPDAHISKNQGIPNGTDFDSVIKGFTDALKVCTDDKAIKLNLARTYYQWDESKKHKKAWYSNNIQKAESILIELLERKPTDDVFFLLAIINFKHKKNFKTAIEYYNQVLDINPLRFAEITEHLGLVYNEMALNSNKE